MRRTRNEKAMDSLIMIRMPSPLRKGLEELAEEDRRALSDYCRLVLEDHAKQKGKLK